MKCEMLFQDLKSRYLFINKTQTIAARLFTSITVRIFNQYFPNKRQQENLCADFIKNRLQHRWFSLIFAKFLRTNFLKNTPSGSFYTILYSKYHLFFQTSSFHQTNSLNYRKNTIWIIVRGVSHWPYW